MQPILGAVDESEKDNGKSGTPTDDPETPLRLCDILIPLMFTQE